MPDSDAHTLAMLLQTTGGDGFNGDTMFTIPETFWTAAAVDRQYPIALEPEDGGIDDGLNWHTLGWGYWDFQAEVPIVDRFKFLTRGKFLTHACDRWAKNKTNNLHAAFFNGAGYEAWENVWGVWNGIVPRDGEAIRRMAAMLRFLEQQRCCTCYLAILGSAHTRSGATWHLRLQVASPSKLASFPRPICRPHCRLEVQCDVTRRDAR